MKYKRHILKNGLRVITVPLEDNPTVTVLVLVEAGSKYETKNINGISHFLEHMCFKGTMKRPTAFDITRELDGLGAQSNAFTAQEYTGYYAKAEKKHLAKLVDILADIYIHPTFNTHEIEREKGVIVDEIHMYEDMPSRKAAEVFMELLYGDQPAGWDVGGVPEIIKKLTREDFISYRDKHYLADATTVVVSGAIDQKDTLKLIEEKFLRVPSGKKERKIKTRESQTKPGILTRFKDTSQTHLVLGCRSTHAFHKDKYIVDVLSAVLGGGMSSRLFQKIREEMGVGYYVSSFHDTYTDHGYLATRAGVSNERASEVITAILEEFVRLKEELVSEKELKKVKDYLTGNFFLGLESSDDVAEYYGIQEVMGKQLKKPKDMAREIRDVSASDIRRVAKHIFQDKKLNLALIGPYKDGKVFEKLLRV